VTAGTLPANPAELIGSPRFTAFLRQLEASFDVVVIDTPPVMVVADASILGAPDDGVLFVVDADSTSRMRHGRARSARTGATHDSWVRC
jgi:Mrp family chromosome partitioning ATPase